MLHISTDVPRVRNESFSEFPTVLLHYAFWCFFLNLIFVSVLEQQFILLFYIFKHGRPTCRLPLSYLYFSLHNCLNVNTAVLCANTSIFASRQTYCIVFLFRFIFLLLSVFIRTFCLYTFFHETKYSKAQ